MPFSKTKKGTEAEWTELFNDVLKPAVESAGLDYECRRSKATRGNMVASIIRDLRDAYVVIADLTDRNANVFYELGVRHTLRNRTIVLTQDATAVPFDLQPYAYHVYEWRTEQGRKELTSRLHELLADIDAGPDRPDNPVSDFLGKTDQALEVSSGPLISPISPDEAAVAQSLVGVSSDGLNVSSLVRELQRTSSGNSAMVIHRLSLPMLHIEFNKILGEMDQSRFGEKIKTAEIPNIALSYFSQFEPSISKIESFALSSVQGSWDQGVLVSLKFAGDLISLSNRLRLKISSKFVFGIPELFAWRLLILMGAVAINADDFESLEEIMHSPIESEEQGARFSHLPFLSRTDLFASEAYLGYANHSIKHFEGLWERNSHLHEHFTTELEMLFEIGRFLTLYTLADSARDEARPMYPGYRFLSQAERSISSVTSRIGSLPKFRDQVARLVLREDGSALQSKWSELANRVNSAATGEEHYWKSDLHFPTSLAAQ